MAFQPGVPIIQAVEGATSGGSASLLFQHSTWDAILESPAQLPSLR